MDYNTFHQPRPDQQYPFGQQQYYHPTPPPQRHASTVIAAFATVVCLMLISGGVGFYFGHNVDSPASTPQQQSDNSASNPTNIAQLPQASSNSGTSLGSAASIAAAVDPGLVDINTSLTYQQEKAAGTGMVLTSTGLVLTNNHVIDGETSMSAVDIGNGKTYGATIVGYDKTGDVALIQLQNASGLTTVKLGNSSDVNVGDSIVGIGNAGGAGGTPSYAAGEIVALNQSITASDEGSDVNTEQLSNMIEINADIQPGDSGGPLVESDGEVVGMDTAGEESSSGGFGIPSSGNGVTTQAYAITINTALSLARQIDAGDASSTIHIGSTAFLGVEVEPATTSGVSGALVDSTLSGTPAAATALTHGDVITSLDGQTVSSIDALGSIVLELKPGQTVPLGYTTPTGTTATLSIQLASGPPQ